ncbi:MAG: ABC-2 family transporter protein [Chloroflexi bacterium]|nr:ABC-2 family transporter protein [Chloroflexota bacterium]
MRLIRELVSLSFRRQITYRAAAFAGLATNFFFGILRAAVITALYGARGEVAGISLQAAVTYTGFTQAIIAYLSLFGWYEMMETVSSGDIASDLLKPMGLFQFWMARDLGRAAANLILRGVPLMAGYWLLYDITFPAGAAHWLAFLASLVLAWMVSFAWRFLVNLTAFWVSDAVGIGRLFFTLSWFLSGFVMPLRYLPDWFTALCNLTPFPHTINTVVETYLGILTPAQTAQALLMQAAWFVALAAAAHFVMRAGVRRLVVQGG